ncbi:MAG: ATP-dependent nuclease [Nitriliruptoraceae bacterium]
MGQRSRGAADVPACATPTLARIRDLRSVWGPPLEVPLGEHVTVLVGPNRAGTTSLAWAIAAAFDPTLRFAPGRDLPHGRLEPRPGVTIEHAGGELFSVAFDPDDGGRRSSGDPPGAPVVLSQVEHTPRDLLRRLPTELTRPAGRGALAEAIRELAHDVLPEVASVEIDEQLTVRVFDELGSQLPVPGTRAMAALAVVRHLAAVDRPASLAVVEAPEAFLHPAAQEVLGRLLPTLAAETGTSVLVTTSSPFIVPRTPGTQVVALARGVRGRTEVVGTAAGDQTQARLLGGLLRDSGLAEVLDRVAAIPPRTRGVLIVEGGTDAAYLRLVAAALGREQEFADVVIRPSGGAMGAALAALVLRAEVDVPVVVLLDHDDPGRRARDTLVSRFGFDRQREVVTYADVLEGGPLGVEAETLFDPKLLRRFVAEQGPSASHGERELAGARHPSLTASGKSALVGWLAGHVRPEHLDAWRDLLDLLAERLPPSG